jgi:hypothetical protein
MLSWWQWCILAAIPPAIVLLYFLKLRRRPLEVPSTYLWRRSIEDLRVNTLWQRLRRNILLLLQLMIIAVVAAALVRPGWSGSKLVGTRFVFLIDTSASMSASDAAPSRLEEAKRRAGDLILQMAGGDVAMIVSFSDAARVEQPFTSNRRELRQRLDAITPTARRTRLDEALRVASGLANPAESAAIGEGAADVGLPTTVYLFSDGRFPDLDQFALGNLHLVYVPIGSPQAANVAITAFSTRRREDRSPGAQAFARLENLGTDDVSVEAELWRDGALADARRVEIAPRGAVGAAFDLDDARGGVLQLRIKPGGALALDDRAWIALAPAPRPAVLCVTTGDEALVRALTTEKAQAVAEVTVEPPEFLASTRYESLAAAGHWALVIYDRCRPRELPQANTVFIGGVPEGSSWTMGPTFQTPQVLDVDTAHPLLQWIDLGNVRFVQAAVVKPPPGSTVLIDSTDGPLMAIASRGSFEDAVLGPEIVGNDSRGEPYANTDWPLRLSFPVFVLNALSYLGGADKAPGVQSFQPGEELISQPAGGATKAELRSPDGTQISLETRPGDPFRVNGSDALGIYELTPEGGSPQRFAVNLFDGMESDLATRPEIRIGPSEIKGQAGWEGARRELWKPLLLGALGVLCVEWYIYVRRSRV